MIVVSCVEYFFNKDSFLFWLLFSLGALVVLVNTFWLSKKFSQPFIFPYFLTMIKSKKLVKHIYSVSHYAKFLEKFAFLGLFIGFGLTWVDYWKARKLGGWKRIVLLLVFAVLLGLFFELFLKLLFRVPILEPLTIVGLIGFILLGLGGLSLAILVGYGVMSIFGLFSAKQMCPSIAPVIPGVPIPGFGGLTIPMIAWVSLGMILVIHELSHGVMLAYYKKKIHSVGLLVAGIFPMGAFVEEDNTELATSKDHEVLMMLSAGPASNFFTMIIGIILLFLFALVLVPFTPTINQELNLMYEGVGVFVVDEKVTFCGIEDTSPALGKLFVGDKIISLNGEDINNTATLNSVFVKSKGDMNFVVQREDKNVEVILTPIVFEDMNVKRIGAQFGSIKTNYEPPIWIILASMIISAISSILVFFIILSLAVAMFNYLPANPLDGGKIAEIILVPYAGFMKFGDEKETRKFIGRIFVWLFLISLLLNLIPYITMLF
ncbi:MAG: hypothetical protein GX950_01330 [Candidatus Diapherotrites archaeon]|uniref:Peptidase M50 domain-containing protein n=1 Tax=Candidatus Iainarchaeum sp. TaxID=3101447 RepID=A0A7K4BZC9_9ARCH|nr:hypothetical protein [Candidatus Diapherotrites archaeon]